MRPNLGASFFVARDFESSSRTERSRFLKSLSDYFRLLVFDFSSNCVFFDLCILEFKTFQFLEFNFKMI